MANLRPRLYSIRAVLVVTALVAAMFAPAPPGYVATMFAVPGAGLYWLVSGLARARPASS